jgi:hypothetical protein
MAFLDLSGNRSGRGGDCGGECVVGMECEEPIPFGCLVVHGGGKFVTSSCWTAEPSPALNEKMLLAVLRGRAFEAVKNLAVTERESKRHRDEGDEGDYKNGMAEVAAGQNFGALPSPCLLD